MATVLPLPEGPVREPLRHADRLALGGALALAAALRLPWMTAPLSRDEGGVAWVAQQWTTAHGSLYGGQWLDRPPLLVALYRLAEPGGAVGIRTLAAVAALVVVLGAWSLARALGGARAARLAALVAALLTGAKALGAVAAPAELLAAGPAVWSLRCLVEGHRSRRARWLAAAGALAMAALLVKQSFGDAGLAGLVYLLATRRLRGWLAYTTGVAAALVPVGVYLLVAQIRVGALLEALIGFRAQSLTVLQASGIPLPERLQHLGGPVVLSGLVLALPLAVAGILRLRAGGALKAALIAWLCGGVVGVLGGGSYWSHYLIQLCAPAAVGTGLALAAVPRPPLRAALALVTAAALAGGAVAATSAAEAGDPNAGVARYIRAHARPGDSFYALYARANLDYAVGLPTPFPYSWSLMMRARPDARPRLLALLRSPQRPTWIAVFQRPSHWGLDPHGRVRAALRDHYRLAARIHGHRVLRSVTS